MAIRRHLVNRLVEELLQKNGIIAPPVPVDKIARSCGATIAQAPDEKGLSGFLLRESPSHVVIGVNKGHGESRKRFTVAHELGHLVLHAAERIHVDRSSVVFLRSPNSSKGVDPAEMEANLFAAELLMPRRFLENDVDVKKGVDLLDDKESIKRLARRYEVSEQAMTIRLANVCGWLTF
jgi:hypothetical protein